MKAVILAAGYGTRLKELAINKSKPLIEIAGKPIIEHIIKKIEELDNIDEIYIITNNKFYHNFLNWEKHFKNKIAIKILNDGTNSNEEKLGAVGDFAFAVEKEHLNEDILLIAGDNLFKLSLKQMFTFFKEKNSTVIAGIRMSKDYIAKRFGNIISDKNVSTNDSLVVDLLKNSVIKHLPLKEGANIYVLGGKHMGSLGTIEKVVEGDAKVKIGKESFQIPLDKVYVIE